MVRIIKKSLCLLSLLVSFYTYADAKLIDQSVAVVEKKVVTLRDVQTRILADSEANEPSPYKDVDVVQGMREILVEEYLIDSFFQTGQIKKIKLEPNAFIFTPVREKELKDLGVSKEAVLKMFYLKKQKELFINSFISLRANLRPGDLESYYETSKDQKYQGRPLSAIRKTVEEDLKSSKLKDEYKKWRDSQILRSNVVFLPLPPVL